MKEMLKMVSFDYITVKDIGIKYVWMFGVISIVLCSVGMFPVALMFLLFPLEMFAPVQTFRKGDFMKVYGLLPVKREHVTRALFFEVAVPQFIGGIICELLLLLSRAVGESHILPSFLQKDLYDKFIEMIDEYGMTFSDVLVLAAVASALITIVVLVLYSILEIKGETIAIVSCIVFLLLICLAVVLYIMLFTNSKAGMPTIGDTLPDSAAVKVITIFVSFAAIAAAALFLCEFTVKKTASKEI